MDAIIAYFTVPRAHIYVIDAQANALHTHIFENVVRHFEASIFHYGKFYFPMHGHAPHFIRALIAHIWLYQ